MYSDLRPILDKTELLLSELAQFTHAGPTLKIVHRFHIPETNCLSGEEVWAIFVVHRGRETHLPLSLALRLLLNYLAEAKHIPQSATQIAAGMRRSAFYVRHGKNSGTISRRKINRSAVKEYVKRLRIALSAAFREAAIHIEGRDVLTSQETTGNEVHYRLRANVQWVHVPGDDLSR